MAISLQTKNEIDALKWEYDSLKDGHQALLDLIFETELPENVYNSNAIENSTLTLPETERILLELEVSRVVSVRELFEATNLAMVMNYIKDKLSAENINLGFILLLHKMVRVSKAQNSWPKKNAPIKFN
jgi:Fic family protein